MSVPSQYKRGFSCHLNTQISRELSQFLFLTPKFSLLVHPNKRVMSLQLLFRCCIIGNRHCSNSYAFEGRRRICFNETMCYINLNFQPQFVLNILYRYSIHHIEGSLTLNLKVSIIILEYVCILILLFCQQKLVEKWDK